jgi:hypothetical protein
MRNFTAFPLIEDNLRDLIRHIDAESLRKKRIPACSFLSHECIGMCCSLPVAVTQEEAGILTRLVKDKAKEFRNMGLRLRRPAVLFDAKTERSYLAKRKRNFLQLNKIIYNVMPADLKVFLKFIRTCVFSMRDGSCALQRLSIQEGLHKWYYKPVNCWKYPLSIDKGCLTLPEKPGNAHFPCDSDRGTSACEGLKEELEFMGDILHRDIMKEILAVE